MHIHSYQIQNVLSVYHKQLSQGTARGDSAQASKMKPALDRIDISVKGLHQTLFEKISSEIVERITHFEPGVEFESMLAGRMAPSGNPTTNTPVEAEVLPNPRKESSFTYTLIDEHNRKRTQKLPIKHFGAAVEDMASTAEPTVEIGANSDTE